MADGAADDAVQQYGNVLEQLSGAPFNRDLYVQRIALAKQLGLADEVESARTELADRFPLSEAEWSEWIADKKEQLPPTPVPDVEPYVDLLELYRRAVRDYLSIPLLVSFSQWVIAGFYTAQGLSAPPQVEEDDEDEQMAPAERRVGEPDPLLGVVFSAEAVREICQEVMALGGLHISESTTLWNVWRDLEMDLLKMEKTPDQLLQVEELYLARLKVPHLNIKQTFDDYSSFVTKYDNDNYEQSLPAASKIYSGPASKAEERDVEEIKLKAAGYTAQAYLAYIGWECEVKRPDVPLVKALCERAVKDHPTNLELWENYLEFSMKIPQKESNLLQVAEKAVRNLPTSASLWATYFRASEKLQQGSDGVEGLFQRAIATGFFENDMEGTVALYHARAAFHRRELDRTATEEDGPNAELIGIVLGVLQEGIAKTKQIHKKGDPQHRLEKFMLRVYERFQMTEEASQLWEELTKLQPYSYAVWYGRADFETRVGNYKRAHDVYVQGCSARGLDYPEYLIEAWMTFENECGTFDDLQFAMIKSKRQKKGLERRRANEAAQAAASAAAATPAVQASTSAAAPAPADADSFIASATQADTEGGRKRERSPHDETSAAAKKVKIDAPPAEQAPSEPKRDRENSTVFAISPGSMSEEDVRKLFRDCGEIRECKVKVIENKTYAMLEFMDKESVLAAQTKDKKRVNEVEIEVHVAWQSCLYVTNFPEAFDKPAVEKLFEKYGVIFDTRWPSKRFKNTRRFCYVQFSDPAHAQAALELNGSELEPGHRLGVYISDPGRKKSRSDTGANNRELYIASLSKFVKEDELRKVFEPFGALKGIRLVTDEKGDCKGFAFVEYEDEASAQAALSLNNHELRKRRMAVTIAQPRATGTAKNNAPPERKVETESRSVRVRGLAPGTEEAIIQQAFEKLAPVRRIIFEAGSTEAVVLLEHAPDVGKVLMHRDSIAVDGVPVEVLAEGRQTRTAAGKKPSSAPAKDVPLMPRQASRGRGRVGLAGGRGARGGRMGLGARPLPAQAVAATTAEGASTSGEGAAVESTPAAGAKSQDDFRAMLLKK
ncbi:hypothetical protein JCM5296_000867 [Sporobolomyces johnsonii]